MFEVSVEYTFAAGHALRGYRGKCENVHGHNYKLRVTVQGEKLNSIGLLMDFADLRAAVRSLVERFDHQFLNDLEPFREINPSAENLAWYVGTELQREIRQQGLSVNNVTVWETDTTSASYRPPAGTQLESGEQG
ncbi:MAG TPA: 6-carboxytetrahydropterin synthase QueD [Terriglobia bacterium]|jgi:6-pyruvoyltetrahydropterin/6-carboxytetrahydropterin synthase|nr:6-carboxytetrahydropterin synthase QueD [Terriglobia bacterium]